MAKAKKASGRSTQAASTKAKKVSVRAAQAAPKEAKPATAATPRVDVEGDEASLAQARLLRDRHPALTAEEVTYFEARQPVEQAQSVGATTSAADVLPDSVRLAARYVHARAASSKAASFITEAQMRWLFEHIVKLGEAVAKRDRLGAATTEVSLAVQQAWDAARAPRNALTDAMDEYAKGNETDLALLARARGTVVSPAATLASLDALAPLAEQWLTRTDALAKVAAREASLTPKLCVDVRAAAATLRAAIEGDTDHAGSRRTGRDTPEINALEGRVVLTLRTVRHNHQRAREADATLETVAVPESLRRALRVKVKAKTPAAPVDPNAPAVPKPRRTKR